MSALLRYILTRAWAVEPGVLLRGADLIRRHALGERVDPERVKMVVEERDSKLAAIGRPRTSKAPADTGFYLAGRSVGVVPVEGVISRYASMVNGASQPEGTTTDAIIGSIRAALADARVKTILLDIDSPGGTVSGVDEVGAEIRRASAQKPVVALARDMMASAAYWIGSQASGGLYATPTAVVGSIGVYCVVEDSSRAADRAGFTVHVVRDGDFKGRFIAGTQVDAAALAELSEEIHSYGRLFRAAVAGGRKMSDKLVETLADGRVHIGQAAVTLKLADGLAQFDELVERLDSSEPNPRGRVGAAQGERMTLAEFLTAHPECNEELNTRIEAEASRRAAAAAPKPATIAQLKEAFPGDGAAAFRESCLERSLTLDAAKADRNGSLQKELETEKAAHAKTSARVGELEAQLKSLGGEGRGTAPVSTAAGNTSAGQPENYAAAVTAVMDEAKAAGKPITRAAATKVVNERWPKLREALATAPINATK